MSSEADTDSRGVSTSPEADIEPSHLSVPEDPSPENIPKVTSPTIPLNSDDMDIPVGYTLPFRHNRGKPPNRYSPDIGERSSKYP
ncbi:hypothetical protein PJO48_29655, partial [Mycobacterium kansasii]